MLSILVLAVDIIFLLLFIAVLVFYVFIMLGWKYGAPFVPSSLTVVKEMINLAKVKPGEIVFDLGSGDGRILIASAQAGARAQGWEIHPLLVVLTRLKVWWLKLGEKVKVFRNDFWQIDWQTADVIMIYLIPHRMQEFKEKLLREVRPGTRVVSHAFKVPGWEPKEERSQVRLYIVPPSSNG